MKLQILLTVVVAWAALTHAHNAHQGGRVEARTLPLMMAPLRIFNKGQEEVVINGQDMTIGLASAYSFAGVLDETWNIFGKIINVLIPSTPEEDIDYFAVIEENVKQVVGDYIDQHNLDQLEVYKDSLGVLLQRYVEAPVESSSYPDKNTIANSLSTSIVANRYLVETGQYPQSMIIHYADIASIHILVLKDVACVYSEDEKVSRWWQDLEAQLDHYIQHGKVLRSDIVDWRNDMMTCDYDEGGKYDIWTVNDPVTGVVDKCTQVHDTDSCDDHCQAYQITMNREVSAYVWEYLGKALREWEALKVIASQMADRA